MRLGLLLTAFLALAAPATAGGMLSYGWVPFGWNDGGHHFLIYVHPHDSTLMLQSSDFFSNAPAWPLPVWRHAAESLVRPAGCDVSDTRAVTRVGGTWEVTVVCPDGVDIRALIKAQKASIKRGEPLHN